jgi:hypothetical protein
VRERRKRVRPRRGQRDDAECEVRGNQARKTNSGGDRLCKFQKRNTTLLRVQEEEGDVRMGMKVRRTSFSSPKSQFWIGIQILFLASNSQDILSLLSQLPPPVSVSMSPAGKPMIIDTKTNAKI